CKSWQCAGAWPNRPGPSQFNQSVLAQGVDQLREIAIPQVRLGDGLAAAGTAGFELILEGRDVYLVEAADRNALAPLVGTGDGLDLLGHDLFLVCGVVDVGV